MPCPLQGPFPWLSEMGQTLHEELNSFSSWFKYLAYASAGLGMRGPEVQWGGGKAGTLGREWSEFK